jgi:hypothetical protein
MRLDSIIGQGRERAVYRHPKEKDRAIKIMKPTARHDRNTLEMDYWRTAPAGLKAHVSEVFGQIETDLGTGMVCELITDHDGQPSRSIVSSVEEGTTSVSEARQMLEDFFRWADRMCLPIFDNGPGNILLQHRSDSRRLVIVDGFGMGARDLKWRLRMTFPALVRRVNAKTARRMMDAWDRRVEGTIT